MQAMAICCPGCASGLLAAITSYRFDQSDCRIRGLYVKGDFAENEAAWKKVAAIKLDVKAQPHEVLPQLQRIVCRMLGDIILPYTWRTGTQPPWYPDLLSPNGRTHADTPYVQMRAACDIGHPPFVPVTWADVLRILPCMGNEDTLRILERALRAKGNLLPDDTLQHVNLGPWLAMPPKPRKESQPPSLKQGPPLYHQAARII